MIKTLSMMRKFEISDEFEFDSIKYKYDEFAYINKNGESVDGLIYYVNDVNENILDEINDENNFNDCISDIKAYAEYRLIEEDEEGYISYMNICNRLREMKSDVFVDINTIYLDGEFTCDELLQIKERNQNFFKNCSFVFNKKFKLDRESYEEAKIISNIFPGIQFCLIGNVGFIDINEFENSLNAIDNLVDENLIKDFSPLEKLVYIFDIVRSRNYVIDSDSEYIVSRDLSKVLIGNEIVCVGFVNIFNYLLNKYGISCEEFYMDCKDKNEAHVRSVVHLVDDKYGIDGIYYCDPTWGSKRGDSNNYLRSYLYFCNTFDKMVELDNDNFKYVVEFPKDITSEELISIDKNTKYPFPRLVTDDGYICHLVVKNLGLSRFMNYYESLLDIESISGLFEKADEVCDRVSYFKRKALVPIKPESLISAISKVRKQLSYQNPKVYPYDENVLFNILNNSKFGDYRPELRLLSRIFGDKFEEEYIPLTTDQCRNVIMRLFKTTDLGLDVKRTQLTKILKYLAEEKEKQEQIKLIKTN